MIFAGLYNFKKLPWQIHQPTEKNQEELPAWLELATSRIRRPRCHVHSPAVYFREGTHNADWIVWGPRASIVNMEKITSPVPDGNRKITQWPNSKPSYYRNKVFPEHNTCRSVMTRTHKGQLTWETTCNNNTYKKIWPCQRSLYQYPHPHIWLPLKIGNKPDDGHCWPKHVVYTY